MQAAPHTVFLSALACLGAATLSCIWFVTNVPTLGIATKTGESGQILARAGRAQETATERSPAWSRVLSITPRDGSADAVPLDSLGRDLADASDYRELDERLSAQSAMHRHLNSPEVEVRLAEGRTLRLQPSAGTALSELPVTFWYRLALAGIGFLAVAGVWAFRPAELTTRLFIGAGVALCLFTLCEAILGAPGLGMDGRLLGGFLTLSHLALYAALACLVSLAWVRPTPLPAAATLSVALFVMAGLWWVADFLRLLPSPRHGPAIAALMAAGLAALPLLLRASKPPVVRDGQAWLRTLRVLLPLVIALYLLVGPASELVRGQALLGSLVQLTLVHLVFLGTGVAIYLRSLFGIDRWVWSAWVFCGVSAALLALDLVVVYALGYGSERVFILSLAALAWLYFPIRQVLWSRWSGRVAQGDYRDIVPDVFEELLSMHGEGHQESAWHAILQRLWAPLSIDPDIDNPERAELMQGGAGLLVPHVPAVGSVVMWHAGRGSRLFSADDVRLAETLALLARKIASLRDSARSGAAAERRRVAADLHDHVVPSLLSYIYRADQSEAAGAGRAAMKELRGIIGALEHPQAGGGAGRPG